jgi:hypothetical protein
MQKIKYWWSDDKKWFCILLNDGVSQATVSLTPEEASLLSMNAVLDDTSVPLPPRPARDAVSKSE